MSLRKIKAWSAAVALSVLCAPSMAAWPEDQTIELVVGFAPGGGTDLMARALVPFLEKNLVAKHALLLSISLVLAVKSPLRIWPVPSLMATQ